MSLQSAYWRFFNFLVRRVVAVAFAVGGIMALVALPSLFDPNGTILVNGQPERDLFYRVFAFLMPAIMAALGVLMYRAPPFVPPVS
jgi:hypothetical protein